MKVKNRTQIAASLLAWYGRRRRDLPWRGIDDPYRIWVSEVMLQQTGVATVIPYYERFVARFPTVNDLAGADPDEVLKLWENLGYYARARNMHRAAGIIVSEHGGRVPSTWPELTALPGVGEYIAGALLSLAYGAPVPAVDGNVRRVWSRVFGVRESIDRASGRNEIRRLAEALVPEDRPGDFNQAVMELGATVCRPKKPACEDCPLGNLCWAYKNDMQTALPVRDKKPPVPHHDVTAGIVRSGNGRLLVVRRPENGLLGGLWKWPGGTRADGESLEEGLVRSIREETGLLVAAGDRIASVNHQYSHFKITLHAYACSPVSGRAESGGSRSCRWVTRKQLNALAWSKADREILDRL